MESIYKYNAVKKLVFVCLLIVSPHFCLAQQWQMWETGCANIISHNIQNITFTANVTSKSYDSFQLFIASTFNVSPGKKYKMHFEIISSKPFTLRSRFGSSDYTLGNYFIDVVYKVTQNKQTLSGPEFETADVLLDKLFLFFQSNDILQFTEVEISNIRFQEIKETSELMVVETDSIVYDLMGSPFRTDSVALANGWQEWGKHEGLLNVSRIFDWGQGARPKDWMSPGSFKAITAWGQIVEDRNGSAETNARIQLRNHKMYVLYDADWKEVEDVTATLEAKLYTTDYILMEQQAPNVRAEAEKDGGGVSIETHNDVIIHWWRKWNDFSKRVQLTGNEKAIFIRCEMRLIQNNQHIANLSNARYYGGVGADYYPEVWSEACPGGYCDGLLLSRHKRITEEWRVFTSLIIGNSWPVTMAVYEQAVNGLTQLPPYVKRSVTSTIATNLDSSVVLSYDRVMQRLYIVADLQDVEYTIVSIEGRPLSKGIFNDTIDISTAGWQPGVYIAVFYAGDRVVVRKVVV